VSLPPNTFPEGQLTLFGGFSSLAERAFLLCFWGASWQVTRNVLRGVILHGRRHCLVLRRHWLQLLEMFRMKFCASRPTKIPPSCLQTSQNCQSRAAPR